MMAHSDYLTNRKHTDSNTQVGGGIIGHTGAAHQGPITGHR